MAPTDDAKFDGGDPARKGEPKRRQSQPDQADQSESAGDELAPIELEPPRPSDSKKEHFTSAPTPSGPAEPKEPEAEAGPEAEPAAAGEAGESGEAEAAGEFELNLPADEEQASAAPSQMPLRPRPEEEEERYCLACGYSLRGLDSRECPECGHPFDPTDPHTYRSRPMPSAAATAAELAAQSLRTRLWLGSVLALLLLGRGVAIWLAGDQGQLTLLGTHPFWIAAVIWLVFGLVRNDRFHGLIFWMFVGAATGAILGLLEGPCALASGTIIGLIAGIFRENVDLASV